MDFHFYGSWHALQANARGFGFSGYRIFLYFTAKGLKSIETHLKIQKGKFLPAK
jgi:uncharacterized protein involved in high-affinity Fe2+ transport